jgi:hypothetical protein
MRVLALLRPRDLVERPSLAVLSPYREQMKALKNAIGKQTEGALSHLSQFSAAIEPGEFCGTVDSFQGAEADAVVISLVRNNTHSTPAKSLGFLRDNRRMNVLLSRAKWRLILIGSLSFYENIVALSAKVPDQDIGFLKKFLDALQVEVSQKQATIVPWSKLKGH